jgi:hypothetical protein
MRMDDVELVRVIEHLANRRVEPRRPVRDGAGRPERPINGWHETAGHSRITAGERRDVVTAGVELVDERGDDPFRAAIATRGNGFEGRRDLGDAKRTVQV